MSRPVPLMAVRDLSVRFRVGRRVAVEAVSKVSFTLFRGETLGLVGESGCGKTTVARALVRLQEAASGSIRFDDIELVGLNGNRLRKIRPDIQMIFQNAAASLNPGRRVGRSVAEPLRVLGRGNERQRMATARALLAEVGIDPDTAFTRLPFAFSSGQCQRISIARALITNPRLLICDEPVSALDVSVQAQILNLLRKIKSRRDLTMLFISHDLAVIKNICDRVAVMYMGRLCETADVEALYRRPCHPYTAALLAAVPSPDRRRSAVTGPVTNGTPPSPLNPPQGCRYHPQCPQAQPRCAMVTPVLEAHKPGRQISCHFPLQY